MTQSASALRHLRAPRALHFPVGALVPETKLHFKLRTALYTILELAFADRARIGSDQFVYWNARDPRRCLAPDVFVRRGEKDCVFDSWKTWERGTPELAVEIVNENEDWDDKLERYHELGIAELVAFDPSAPAGERVRAWDRLEEDLVERAVSNDSTPCVTLGGFWVVAPHDGLDALRLAHDPLGQDLLPTPEEAHARRIAELEAELARRSGG